MYIYIYIYICIYILWRMVAGVIWLVYMCDMTRVYVWHDSFICVTWLIYMHDMIHPYTKREMDWGVESVLRVCCHVLRCTQCVHLNPCRCSYMKSYVCYKSCHTYECAVRIWNVSLFIHIYTYEKCCNTFHHKWNAHMKCVATHFIYEQRHGESVLHTWNVLQHILFMNSDTHMISYMTSCS